MNATASNTTAITAMGAARAKGGHEGDVRQALHAFVEPARVEDGCLSCELYEDVQYTGSFYTVETFNLPLPLQDPWTPGLV